MMRKFTQHLFQHQHRRTSPLIPDPLILLEKSGLRAGLEVLAVPRARDQRRLRAGIPVPR